MAFPGDKFRIGREESPVSNRRRSVVWILAAFGLLIVGLAGGTAAFAWKREWASAFPVVGFGAYLFAFRRGMLLWNPAADGAWRRYIWLGHGVTAEDESAVRVADEEPDETLEILRRETPRLPRHGLKVVR